jgi:hypothetical protein
LLDVAHRRPHRSDLRRVSVCQAIVASFLALDANHCSIDCSLVGSTVEGDLSRTAGRRVVPDELNASDSLATWPLPNRLEVFLRSVSYVTAVRLDLIMPQRPQAWLPPPAKDGAAETASK